ncbi:MAG: HAD family phosphatase [Firmicutes bacterium]|nr:HAD family phosphatase [Bacillota bacterium]
MRVRNVIFDIGNVLLSFRPKEYLRSLGFSEEEVELYSRIIFRSSLWLDLDRGLVNEEEAVARLAAKHPKHAQGIERVFADWYAMFVPLEGVKLLPKLKEAGYRLYALSNFHRDAFGHVRSKYHWFDLFDGMVISYEVHAIKPEPEIYRALIDRYGIDPKESVFIDDVKKNIDRALLFSFHTIHHTSFEETVGELRRFVMLEL